MQGLARGYLIVLSVLDGVAGLVCGVLFIAAPDGRLMQAGTLLSVVRTLPLADVFFQDFLWIGIAMLLVLAVPNLVAATMLLRRSHGQYFAALASGTLLILWTGFELVFMFNVPAVGYFIAGTLSILASALLLRSSEPEPSA